MTLIMHNSLHRDRKEPFKKGFTQKTFFKKSSQKKIIAFLTQIELKKDEDKKYKFLTLKQIKKYEKIAKIYKVSEVARGIKKGTKTDKGFLEMYKKVNGKANKLQYIPIKENKPEGQDYWSYRIGFINSRLGQMRAQKTPLYYSDGKYKGYPTKQHIILILHGYSPDKTLR